MNDLDLHRRLSDLADGLSSEADPLADAATARSAHRRRRRNRLVIAGATAAVAVLAIGGPIAWSTLAAPQGGEVAAPTTPAPPSPTASGATETPGAISQLNKDVIRVVNTLASRTPPLDLAAPAESAGCPDATAQLSDAVATVLIRQGSDDPNMGCGWTTTELRAERLSLGITFLRTADDSVHQMIIDETAKTVTGMDDAEHPGTCMASELSGPRRTTVQACSVAGRRTQWTVLHNVGGGAGLWQLSVNVPADVDDAVDDADAVLALVDVAETAW
jgi:hypothetical protein